MRTAVAILVFAALMGAPVVCAIVVCPAVNTHDCCPKSTSFAACPFDILLSAKAALPAVAPVSMVHTGVFIARIIESFPQSPIADEGAIYLHNRVLRI
jgi:hypothetical protein